MSTSGDAIDLPISFQGGGSYGVSLSNGEELALTSSGGRLVGADIDTEPSTLFSDRDSRVENVNTTDRYDAIQLGGGAGAGGRRCVA